jgi:hypothetical protein
VYIEGTAHVDFGGKIPVRGDKLRMFQEVVGKVSIKPRVPRVCTSHARAGNIPLTFQESEVAARAVVCMFE